MAISNSGAPAEAELVITRVFNAPRALVYTAWTEPARLSEWWGPKGYAMTVARMDLRPGGVFLYSQQARGGPVMWGRFVYGEIVAPERLTFINSFCDAAGNVIRHPMAPTWPLEVQNSLTLIEEGGRTTLTLRGGPHNATEAERETFQSALAQVQGGMGGTLSQLEAYLARALQE